LGFIEGSVSQDWQGVIISMQGYNVIWVFNPTADRALFCKRHKEPYKGLYNLVGGKIEQGEDCLAAAYRELFEETGIADIELAHVMDFTYFQRDACTLRFTSAS